MEVFNMQRIGKRRLICIYIYIYKYIYKVRTSYGDTLSTFYGIIFQALIVLFCFC